jgi:hypothetical protein
MSKWCEMNIVLPRREAVLLLNLDLLAKVSEEVD